MGNRKLEPIRQDLLQLYEEKTEFQRCFYYQVVDKTENNIFLKGIFNKKEIKLSFTDKSNLEYKRSSSILVFSNMPVSNKKRLIKLYGSFLFFEKLYLSKKIRIEEISLILEGKLEEVFKTIPAETRKKIETHYGLREKTYYFNISTPDSKKITEMVEKVKLFEEKISSILNRSICLFYSKSNTWFFKDLLTKNEEDKLKTMLKFS